MLQVWISPQETDQPEGGVLIVVSAGVSGGAKRGPPFIYYLRPESIEESLYSAPKSGLDRLMGCD